MLSARGDQDVVHKVHFACAAANQYPQPEADRETTRINPLSPTVPRPDNIAAIPLRYWMSAPHLLPQLQELSTARDQILLGLLQLLL